MSDPHEPAQPSGATEPNPIPELDSRIREALAGHERIIKDLQSRQRALCQEVEQLQGERMQLQKDVRHLTSEIKTLRASHIDPEAVLARFKELAAESLAGLGVK